MEDRAVLTRPPHAAVADAEGQTTRASEGSLTRPQRLLRDYVFRGLASLRILTRIVPRGPSLRLTGALGVLTYYVVAPRRRRVLDHLRLAFPERDAVAQRRLARRIFARLGENLAEVLRLGASRPEEVLENVRFEGLEHLDAALAGRHGVLLVTGHVGCWEIMAAAIALRGYPLNVIAREVYDARVDELVVDTRARFGVKTIQRDQSHAAREILRTLKRGEILGLLIDVDIKAPGAFVPFFGQPAWTPTGAAAFSVRAHAPVVMGFVNREGPTHVIRFEPPLSPETTGDRDADLVTNTARYTARIEAAIRRCPEDWVWTHRRWRRVPGPDGIPYLPHKLPGREEIEREHPLLFRRS
ncbi:MAG: lysophospholipid acyltransferase family protein [Acidobacteriota bacterium]